MNLELGPEELEAIAAALAPRVAALLRDELALEPRPVSGEDEQLVSVHDAAVRAGVSVSRIRRAYKAGELQIRQPGGSGSYRLDVDDVDAWARRPVVERERRAAPSPAPRRSAQVARIDSRRRAEPGSREDLRAIERGTR